MWVSTNGKQGTFETVWIETHFTNMQFMRANVYRYFMFSKKKKEKIVYWPPRAHTIHSYGLKCILQQTKHTYINNMLFLSRWCSSNNITGNCVLEVLFFKINVDFVLQQFSYNVENTTENRFRVKPVNRNEKRKKHTEFASWKNNWIDNRVLDILVCYFKLLDFLVLVFVVAVAVVFPYVRVFRI